MHQSSQYSVQIGFQILFLFYSQQYFFNSTVLHQDRGWRSFYTEYSGCLHILWNIYIKNISVFWLKFFYYRCLIFTCTAGRTKEIDKSFRSVSFKRLKFSRQPRYLFSFGFFCRNYHWHLQRKYQYRASWLYPLARFAMKLRLANQSSGPRKHAAAVQVRVRG